MAKETTEGPSRATRRTAGGGNAKNRKLVEANKWPMLDWAEVEDEAVHVADLAVKFTQSNVGHGGLLNMTMAVPVAYAHAAVDTHLASADAMVFIRCYTVPIDRFETAAAELAAQELADQLEDELANLMDDEGGEG